MGLLTQSVANPVLSDNISSAATIDAAPDGMSSNSADVRTASPLSIAAEAVPSALSRSLEGLRAQIVMEIVGNAAANRQPEDRNTADVPTLSKSGIDDSFTKAAATAAAAAAQVSTSVDTSIDWSSERDESTPAFAHRGATIGTASLLTQRVTNTVLQPTPSSKTPT